MSSTGDEQHRFEFGKNWQRFLAQIDPGVIERATDSLTRGLGTTEFTGKRFLDMGSGSGLFSLVAWQLGADVVSVDLDPHSVACTAELKRSADATDRWEVRQGSVLDESLIEQLGQFDIVYSWGVLHHTGDMWRAIANALACVAPGGTFSTAIYNDQGKTSARWRWVKRWYNRLPGVAKWLILGPAFVRLWGPTFLRDTLKLSPLKSWKNYRSVRGMNAWRDVVDWVGGYPFDVARPEEIFRFVRDRGFELTYLTTCGGGLGCNEFVFRRVKS